MYVPTLRWVPNPPSEKMFRQNSQKSKLFKIRNTPFKTNSIEDDELNYFKSWIVVHHFDFSSLTNYYSGQKTRSSDCVLEALLTLELSPIRYLIITGTFRRSQNAWHEDRTTSDVRTPAGLKGAASAGSRKILINNNIKGAAKHGTGDIPSHCPRPTRSRPRCFCECPN